MHQVPEVEGGVGVVGKCRGVQGVQGGAGMRGRGMGVQEVAGGAGAGCQRNKRRGCRRAGLLGVAGVSRVKGLLPVQKVHLVEECQV